ncbi:thioredoxin family protein [Lapidilactobacillus wuchangensis]|uniref:thioredoxin family protein n=1 Tax=Lapidilactobacillus wuchangensis TaxID=2486001 RepID=UPI000F77E7CB|nr:thioredoxin family protein [Lapidilactobacillus wuchangensis]
MKTLNELPAKDLKSITAKGKTMLFFTATWCGDCRFIKPSMPAIDAEYPDLNFVEVDRDQFMDLAQELGIMGIPSFVAYEDGQEVGRFVSADRKTRAEIENFINNLAFTN